MCDSVSVIDENIERQLVNKKKTWKLEKHKRATITAKVGLGKNHQKMLNQRGNLAEN